MGATTPREAGRLTGKTIAIRHDARGERGDAQHRRDTGESYQAFLAGLATASGIETPTRAGLARLDRKRKKKTSNTDWTNPHDPDAKVTKMKDGRTHLQHAVDMETGAIVAVTRTVPMSATAPETVLTPADPLWDLRHLAAVGIRSSEPTGGDVIGRRIPRPGRRCMAIVAGCGDDAAAA